MTDFECLFIEISQSWLILIVLDVCMCAWVRACLCVSAYFCFRIRGYPPLTLFAHLCLFTSLYSSYQTIVTTVGSRAFSVFGTLHEITFLSLSKQNKTKTLSGVILISIAFFLLPFSVLLLLLLLSLLLLLLLSLLLLWMPCFPLRAILIRSKFTFMICCCN